MGWIAGAGIVVWLFILWRILVTVLVLACLGAVIYLGLRLRESLTA